MLPLLLAQASLPAPDDVAGLSQLVISAVQSGNWALVASLVVMGLVAGLRRWVPESTGAGKWLRSKVGGILANLVLSLAGSLATLLLAGGTFSLPLLFQALSVALGASGTWSVYKNIREALDEGKAQAAGEAAQVDPPTMLDK